MGHEAKAQGLVLESFRHFRLPLARLHLADQLQAKLNPSDVVQQTLLETHQAMDPFSGRTTAELAAWLRPILARNLDHAARDLGRCKRDVNRERSLEAALDESSSRVEA